MPNSRFRRAHITSPRVMRAYSSMVQPMSRPLVVRAYDRVLQPHERWNIGIVEEPIEVFLKPGVRPIVRWLAPLGKGRCFADPFAVGRNQKLYIFCEEFDYRLGKGRIVCIELDGCEAPSRPQPTIQLPVHASHPYLLEQQDTIYCVPETYQAREIRLYRAKSFPLEWEMVSTLVDNFAAIDPTIFQFEDLWWLFCCEYDGGSYDRLFVWYAQNLFGPWTPHSANPVKKDLRSSRPGGTPFIYGGCLYRPAQDCSSTYGARIVINRVTKLTPTQFEEETEAVVEPYADSDYPHGLHTLSSAGSATLLDGKHSAFLNRVLERLLWRHFAVDGTPKSHKTPT